MSNRNREAHQKRQNLAETIKRILGEQTEKGIARSTTHMRLGRVTLLCGDVTAGKLHLPSNFTLTLVDRHPPGGQRLASILTRGGMHESAIVPLDTEESKSPEVSILVSRANASTWIHRLVAVDFDLNASKIAASDFERSPYGLTEQERRDYLDDPIPDLKA